MGKSGQLDPNGSTSPSDDLVASTIPALTWARVLLVTKQHGLVGLLTLAMIYQLGILAKAQTAMCGV